MQLSRVTSLTNILRPHLAEKLLFLEQKVTPSVVLIFHCKRGGVHRILGKNSFSFCPKKVAVISGHSFKIS